MDENTGLNLILALSYGGRQDIVAASRVLARQVTEGALKIDAIDETLFSRYLMTGGIPDPDLLVRTSGEQRISNFLIWQLAYTEFVFTDVLWPDFEADHFREAIDEFRRRERRYGATIDSR